MFIEHVFVFIDFEYDFVFCWGFMNCYEYYYEALIFIYLNLLFVVIDQYFF